MIDLKTVDKTWTLFLDRDGVINYEKKNDYVKTWDEFKFYDNALDGLTWVKDLFGTIVVVTNQKGVGKGVVTTFNLNTIHQNMIAEVLLRDGRIDKIYHCPDLEDDAPNRKPNAGMAFQAKKDFPSIDFSKSFMVGNKLSDMGFGRNAGMHTVFVATTNPEVPFPHPLIDLRYNNFGAFAYDLTK